MSGPVETPRERERRQRSRLVLMSAPFAALAGALAAAAIYAGARKAGASMEVPADPRDPGSPMVALGLVQVALTSIVPAFAGAIVLSLLTRTSRPLTWFVVVACVLVAASAGPLLFGSDPSMARMDSATRTALALMHAVRALVVVWVLARAFLARPARAVA